MRLASRSLALWASVLGSGLGVAASCERNEPEVVREPLELRAGVRRLSVLFLGDRGHHRPGRLAHSLLPVMTAHGIDLFYTERVLDLDLEKLRHYDAVLLYANHQELPAPNEQALLEFVAEGRGFVPVHCASACFGDSAPFIELVGARFRRHGTGTFTATVVLPEHEIMRGLEPFESQDETYVHDRHGVDRTVLAVREDGEGREPWTWVREPGAGRVFYTASGHDERTWTKDGFQELLVRGIRWACRAPVDVEPSPAAFSHVPARVPHYTGGGRRAGQGELDSMQEPLPPEASKARMVVPPEFELTLFAAEPDIRKPIAMAWDERGRLFVAETADYPNEKQPDGAGHDSIEILEDRDGDGRADTFTVFAEGLSIPTSLVCAGGGVIVAQAPDMLLFRDRDGDGRADERRVLFSGFSTADTHAGPSNLRYGFDGFVWGTVGYAGFRGRVGDREHRFQQGIYRFRPDGSELEFVASTTNNTWGLGFSEEGLVFGSTANGNPSVFMGIANRYYENVTGMAPGALQTIAESLEFHPVTTAVRQVDFHGKFTAAAGHALYTARSFPREYWNRAAFVSGPTGHLLHRFFLEPQGAGFVARDGWNLAASDDEWTAPIAAEVGPDGALWFIDWYAYIVQHNPTPRGFTTGKGNAYETPLRDKVHGRIYRLAWRGAPTAATPRAAGSEALVLALGHDNLFWRLTAQRLLVESGERDAVPALLGLLADRRIDGLGLAPGALHALWTLDGLGALDEPRVRDAVEAALDHPAAAVRRAALFVLPRDARARDLVLDRRLLDDGDAQVRLAAFLALGEMPPSERTGALCFDAIRQRRNLDDRLLRDAGTIAAARHDAGFLKAVLAVERADPAAAGATPKEPANLLPNPSFEEARDGQPVGWRVRTYAGEAEHELAATGRSGGHSLMIRSARGADSSFFAEVDVDQDATYRLNAFVKTDDLRVRRGARGASLNVHELQSPEPVRTEPVRGTSDWTEVSVTFDSGDHARLSINCLFGGWGHATGMAFFDDVRLVRVSTPPMAGQLGRIVERVSGHYAARAPSDSAVSTLLALRGAPEPLAAAILDGLCEGWPEGHAVELAPADRAGLKALLESLPEAARPRLVELCGHWGHRDAFEADVEPVLRALRLRLADDGQPSTARVAAAERLLALADDASSVGLVLDAVRPDNEPALGAGLVGALGASRQDGTGAVLLERFENLPPSAQQAAVAVLCRRAPWTRLLLEAVEHGRVSRAAVGAARWQALSRHPDTELAALAARVQGLSVEPSRQAVLERLWPAAEKPGDARRGEELFRGNCALCHAFAGKGGRVGPPLDGIGARDRRDVLTAILDPNRSVESNFQLWILNTRSGQVLSGRLDAETRTTVELLDLAGTAHTVRRQDIERLEPSPVSIMPNGFESLGADGLGDLLTYLCRTDEPPR